MMDQNSPIYVFDLDGVITNPENSQVNEEVVNAMYSLLASGTYLVVNTGRSYDWVEKNLVSRLESRNNEEIFTRFITVCEKGGETVRWVNGEAIVKPSEFALPVESYEITKSVFTQNTNQFQSMFWDETKRTMATIEKKPSEDLSVFHDEQSVLVAKLHEALTNHDVRIDPTTIATDVELHGAGKYAGAKLIYEWVTSKMGTSQLSFISIGDSSSDYEMARCFADQNSGSTFVYVGRPTDKISIDERVQFITTEALFCDGTLEYLTKN